MLAFSNACNCGSLVSENMTFDHCERRQTSVLSGFCDLNVGWVSDWWFHLERLHWTGSGVFFLYACDEKVGLYAKHQLLLADFNQNWNMSTRISKNSQTRNLIKSFQLFESSYMSPTDGQTEMAKYYCLTLFLFHQLRGRQLAVHGPCVALTSLCDPSHDLEINQCNGVTVLDFKPRFSL